MNTPAPAHFFPPQLASVLKVHTLDQDKAAAPRDTVKRAIEGLQRVPELGEFKLAPRATAVPGAYVYSSSCPTLATSGKGLTNDQSMASAVMELVERYSWLHYDFEHAQGYRFASYRDVAASDAALPQRGYFSANFSPAQVIEGLLPEVEIMPLRWVLGTRLHDHAPYYYPLNWHNYLFSSNGLAAGNAREEAIVQATCELIERENVFRVFVEGQRGNRLDLGSIDDPLLSQVLEQSQRAGIEFDIRECGLAYGIPTFLVRGTKAADRDMLTYQGFGHGCHLSPVKALIRAFAEYFEGFGHMQGVQEEVSLPWGALITMWPNKHTGFHNRYHPERFDDVDQTVALRDIPDLSLPDLRDEVTYLARHLNQSGVELVLIDKTHPVIDVPTVRMFSPQLRSVINTETHKPYEMMGALYFEAGEREKAQAFLNRSLTESDQIENLGAIPFASIIFSTMMRSIPMDSIYKGDYRAALANLCANKKNGLSGLKQLIGGVMGSTK